MSGNQPNQVSLKLQDGTLAEPWSTQSEIIKPLLFDQWQTITFNFENDSYINLDPNSQAPTERTDFNRVVIQVNGENNNDQVVAYIDDFYYDGTIFVDPVFDHLVWSDEFDGNGALNATKWFHQTQIPSGGNWYNGEIQHYTDRIDNSFVSGGFLNIVAQKEVFTDQGYTKQYTSARLNSKFAFTYGKIEVRAKLPTGIGTWPAIWMLGQNINESGAYWQTEGFGTTSWPACGEIDIMEHWGNNQNYVQSAMHTPSSFGGTDNFGGQNVPTASTEFHIYTLEWSSEKMVFSVDGIEHYTYNPIVKNADTWPFDSNQYLLFNIAIEPGIDSNFIASSMVIDYVRIYQESSLTVGSLDPNKKLRLYPIPVTDVLNISTHHLANYDVELQIIDVNGRLVFQDHYQTNESKISLNASFLKQGLYFIKLTFENGESSTLKFLKH